VCVVWVHDIGIYRFEDYFICIFTIAIIIQLARF